MSPWWIGTFNASFMAFWKRGKHGFVKTHAISNVALAELNGMQWYLFIWQQKCDPSWVLMTELWLLLYAFKNQWVRARSNEHLLQLRISSKVLINNKGTKGLAVTLPQVRGSTWPKEGATWEAVTVAVTICSRFLQAWQRKYCWLPFPCLWYLGRGSGAGAGCCRYCYVQRWMDVMVTQRLAQFLHCGPGKLIEGDSDVSPSLLARWCTWDRKTIRLKASVTHTVLELRTSRNAYKIG